MLDIDFLPVSPYCLERVSYVDDGRAVLAGEFRWLWIPHSFRERSDCGTLDCDQRIPSSLTTLHSAGCLRLGRTRLRAGVPRVFRITRMNGYNSDADEFYVNVHLNTQMELPSNRDTVLHFFEQMKKGIPGAAELFHEGERRSRAWRVRKNGNLIAGWRSSRAGCAPGISIRRLWMIPFGSTSWCWTWPRIC